MSNGSDNTWILKQTLAGIDEALSLLTYPSEDPVIKALQDAHSAINDKLTAKQEDDETK